MGSLVPGHPVCGKHLGKVVPCAGEMILDGVFPAGTDLHLRICDVCGRRGQYRCYENGTMVTRVKLESFRRLVVRFLDALD